MKWLEPAPLEQIGPTVPSTPEEPSAALSGLRVRGRLNRAIWMGLAVLMLGVLGWGGYQAAPWVAWAYAVEQAGARMDRGMTWPEPRHVDSLPQATDREALEQALAFLRTAMERRPTHPHAYRMAGWASLALADWDGAAAALEQARILAPDNPMLDWEAGLAYEQMVHVVETAPALPLTDLLATRAVPETPPVPINTPFCREGAGPGSCYVGLTTFRLPYAGMVEETEEMHPVFFLHPPAKARLRFQVPQEQTALRFLLGLDPVAAPWGSDGAVFQVWVEPFAGSPQMLFEHRMDRAEAVAGWVPGWADLSPWAGQEVVLVLGTGPGLAGDTTGDWYGWGDVTLTTPQAAAYAAQAPLAHMRIAWLDGGFIGEKMVGRGDEARRAKRYEEALRWYDRAVLTEPRLEGPVDYRRGLVYKALEQWEQAEAALRKGAAAWPSYRDLWYELGVILKKQERYQEAIEVLRQGTIAPEGEIGVSVLWLEVGILFDQLQEWEQARDAYAEALARDQFSTNGQRLDALYRYGVDMRRLGDLNQADRILAEVIDQAPNHYGAHLHRGAIQWALGNKQEGEALLRQAIELKPDVKWAYRSLAGLYARDGRVAEAIDLYRRVLEIDPEDPVAQKALEQLSDQSQP